MNNRRLISREAITYIDVIRIYYHPDKSFAEVLDLIVLQFEHDYQLKGKLLDE